MKNSDFGLLVANMYIAGMDIPEFMKLIFMIIWLGYSIFSLTQGN